MIRLRALILCCGLLPLTACVTSSTNNGFPGTTVDLKQASQDNVNLGIAYLRQGNRDVAMQKVQKAIEQDPDNAYAYTAEALIYNANEEPSRARDAFKIAMRKA